MALSRVKNKYIESMEASKLFGDFLDNTVDGSNLTGIEGIDLPSRHNLALNYLSDNVRNNLDTLKIEQGWVDTFEDADDVVGEGVSVPMTKFDGAADRLERGSDLTGNSDGKKGILSAWVDIKGGNSSRMRIVHNTSTTFKFERKTDNKWTIAIQDSSSTNRLVIETTSTYTDATGLTHILASWDVGASESHLYVNGSSNKSEITNSDANLDYTRSNYVVGATTGGGSEFNGAVGQLYVNFAQYLDFSVQANREKFVYGTGANAKPVDLGPNGEKPTGSSPIIYLNNQAGTFQTNLGTGGNFSVTGQLVDGGYVNGKTYSSKSFTNSYEHLERHSQSLQTSVEKMSNGSNFSNMIGQCLTLSDTSINKVMFRLRGDNSPTGNVVAIITPASGTVGTTAVGTDDIIATSAPIDATSIGSVANHEFTFPKPVKLTAGDYFIGLSFPRGDNNSLIAVFADDVNFASAPGNLAINKNTTGWQSLRSGNACVIFSLYGLKNLDLITKGSDDIGNSPSVAPTKGHMEVLLTERPASGTAAFTTATHVNITSQDAGGISNGSFRWVIPSTYINTSGNKIRIKIRTANLTAEDSVCTGMAIVEQAHNEVGVGIPTQVPFGGHNWSNGQLTFPRQTTIWSDWFDFKIDQNKSYLFILDNTNLVSHDTWGGPVHDTAPAEFIQYSNKPISTGGGSGTYNIAGMNGTIDTAPFTIINAIDEIQIATDQTLNTDIIAEMSRDGGTTYSPVTLSRKKTNISNINYNLLVGEADFNGDPSGTNIVGRVRTANKDKNTIHGISVNWISE